MPRSTPVPEVRTGRAVATAAHLFLAFSVAACAIDDRFLTGFDTGPYEAEIRWTSHGIPHIEADDFGSLGFGTGYAFATLNACVLADIVLTVNAERSGYFGPGDGNLQSDIFHQRVLDRERAERLLEGEPETGFVPSADARALMRGFAEGYNRYLRDTGIDQIPDPTCRGADWVREIDEIDLWRRTAVGPTTMLGGIVGAAPPGRPATSVVPPSLVSPPDPVTVALRSEDLVIRDGSNAWALGREVTASGRGVLLGNPHYPWAGPNRFYRLHQTIPGVLDVTGATLMGNPLVAIGHTDRIAWTHTVSTARRYTLFELELDPADPTRYFHEGEFHAMTSEEVRVPVLLPDGSVAGETRTLYSTHFGPVVETNNYSWTRDRAYAIRTAGSGLRSVDQRIEWFYADDITGLERVLDDYLAVGFNTIAVDRDGNAFYGDVGPAPNVPDAKIEACVASDEARSVWESSRIPILDGSRAECDWDTDPDAVAPGLLAPSDLPRLVSTEFATNSNNSYWLSNPREPVSGLARMLGEEESDIGLRPRLSLLMLEEQLDGASGTGSGPFDLPLVQELMFNNRHLGGELLRDDLVALCRERSSVVVDGTTVHLGEACDALASWDLRVQLDSRGAHLFREFADAGGIRFRAPFDVRDPIGTPHTLDRDDPRVIQALGQAVLRLRDAGIALDARLADVQYRRCGNVDVPIHGGPGSDGIFNFVNTPFAGEEGYRDPVHGASIVMVVEFTDEGPRSEAILAYSQATENPESPYACDQTVLYSKQEWLDMKFTDEAIGADPELRVEVVREGFGQY